MKAVHAVLVLCGAALGALLASLAPALAQPERAAPPPPPPRFQISAFAGQAPNGGDMVHGCYTIDTTTGETWLSLSGGPPQKVPDPPRAK